MTEQEDRAQCRSLCLHHNRHPVVTPASDSLSDETMSDTEMRLSDLYGDLSQTAAEVEQLMSDSEITKCGVCTAVVNAIKKFGPSVLNPFTRTMVCAPIGKGCSTIMGKLVNYVHKNSIPRQVCSFYKLC